MENQPSSAPTPVLLVIGAAGLLTIMSGFAFTVIALSQPTVGVSQPATIPSDGSRILPEANEPGVVTPQPSNEGVQPADPVAPAAGAS